MWSLPINCNTIKGMNYILFGEQFPMIKKKLKRLLSERLGEPDDFNVVRYDATEDDLLDALNDCYCLPLGIERKAVVIDNVSFLSKGGDKEILEKYTELFKEPSDEIDVYLIVRSGDVNEKLELVQYVKENGLIVACNNISKEEWPQYVKKYFNDRGVEIDNDAIYELVERVDGDLTRFLNEGAKLTSYSNHIKVLDVTLMVAKPIEDDVFKLSNALLKGEKATALDIYRGLQLLGSRATDTLIPLLANQFRFMSEVLYLYKNNCSSAEIASELGVKEGRVKANLYSIRSNRFSAQEITRILDNLYKLDWQIKSGQIDRFYGFELFLINFPN